MLSNIYSYEMPDVVVNRSIDELNSTRTWYEKLFGLNKYEYIDYKIIESRLMDFFTSTVIESTEMCDEEADIIWHNFLLDTISYRDFCENYIGKFIDHKPYNSKSYLSKEEVTKIAQQIIGHANRYRLFKKMALVDEGAYLDEGYYFHIMQETIKQFNKG